jgi:phenylacetate-CoA ligase
MHVRESIYPLLSIGMQHLAVTLQGVAYRQQRYGGVFGEYLAELQSSEFASADQLHELELAEMQQMVRFAFEHVPWYRTMAQTLGADWHDFRSSEDLSRLPQTTKEDVRSNSKLFMADVFQPAELIPWHTSGTTGTPLTLLYEKTAVRKLWAFVELYRRQAGVSRLQRRGQFTGKVIVPPSQSAGRKIFWRYDMANRALLLSTMHLTAENLSLYAAALGKYRPEYLSGYPSAIYLLAQYYLSAGVAPPPLRAVLTSAETVLPHQRKAIEEGLRTRLYDQYGQTEMQSFWYECREGNLHVHPLAGLTEIVDERGERCGEGRPGSVVLTGFLNHGMPLLRYAVGDIAEWSSIEKCSCGRNMRIVARLHGRVDDFIYTRERGFVGRLDTVYKGVRNLIEAQIVQLDMHKILVRYVPAHSFSSQDLETLEHNLRARIGAAVGIEFQAVERIPRSKAGKFRPVISELQELRDGRLEQAKQDYCGTGQHTR